MGLRRGAAWGCAGAQQRGAAQGRSVGRGGWEGVRKEPRQALKARRLWHAERTVLPAVAQSKKGGEGLGVWRGWGLSLGVVFVALW